MYIRLTVISNFSKLQFGLHILLLRNFYSPDTPHANHGKQRVNHHFRHGADNVYEKYSDFKLFEIAVCFAHFDFFEISTLVMRKMLTMANIVHIIISEMAHTLYIRFTLFSNFSKLQFVRHILTFIKISTLLAMANIVWIIISNIAHTVYIRFKAFETFRNNSLFCTFWLFRNFYSSDAHHANHGKHSLNHHFQLCPQSVYRISSVWNFSKLQFFLHILTFSKFLLRWCASC